MLAKKGTDMLQPPLVRKLHSAFSIQRWNDQVRPIQFIEMDKHAHKMAIAYCLERCHADKQQEPPDWRSLLDLIEGGIADLLRKCMLSDIMSPVYNHIKTKSPNAFNELQDWVASELERLLGDDQPLPALRPYLTETWPVSQRTKETLEASRKYATYWEFQIIRHSTQHTQTTREIQLKLSSDLHKYNHLPGLYEIRAGHRPSGFVDIIGRLRHQIRWAQIPRIQDTSVLGHSMMVACLAYLLARSLKPQACEARLCNAFFGGLFHDLPEAVTRDIVHPVKNAIPNLPAAIKRTEDALVNERLMPLIEPGWQSDIRYFIEDEFRSKIRPSKDTPRTVEDSTTIGTTYNENKYDPIDGELIKAADTLAAFMEARQSIDCGCSPGEMQRAVTRLRDGYKNEKGKIANLDIGMLFANLDQQ